MSYPSVMVTFALFCYNQERFVAAALRGAFAQTYPRLEIIISDDASTDTTWEIVRRETLNYVGPHSLILNRNSVNLGIGSHINRIMELAHGELIVIAAGDDISFPERVATIVKRWEACGRIPDSLHSAAVRINLEGECVGHIEPTDLTSYTPERILQSNVPIMGATNAWTKRLFDKYGPLNAATIIEDKAIIFRASLLGGVEYISVPLVYYRIGGISNIVKDYHIVLKRRISTLNQYKIDVNIVNGPYETLNVLIDRRILAYKALLEVSTYHRSLYSIWTMRDMLSVTDIKYALIIMFPYYYRLFIRIRNSVRSIWSNK